MTYRPRYNPKLWRLVLVLVPILTLTPSILAQPTSANRTALVIGNANYSTAPLRNPVNDARGMAETLRRLGFEVMHYEDLDHIGMKRAVAEFSERLAPDGVGLFYYSGHGIQVDGKNYLLPIDFQGRSEHFISAESLEVDLVLGKMDGARSRVKIVILDACRNNPYARKFRSVTRGLAFMDAPIGSYIAYATSPGSVAGDGVGQQFGVWTGELLNSLRAPGLKIEDVFKMARLAVTAKTKNEQQPWDASSLTGDFYFSPPQESTREERERFLDQEYLRRERRRLEELERELRERRNQSQPTQPNQTFIPPSM